MAKGDFRLSDVVLDETIGRSTPDVEHERAVAISSAARALVEGERDGIANMANVAALIWRFLPGLNWAGFYLVEPRSGELLLGPFQGKPACVRIALGRGVCGTAAARLAPEPGSQERPARRARLLLGARGLHLRWRADRDHRSALP